MYRVVVGRGQKKKGSKRTPQQSYLLQRRFVIPCFPSWRGLGGCLKCNAIVNPALHRVLHSVVHRMRVTLVACQGVRLPEPRLAHAQRIIACHNGSKTVGGVK